MSPHHAQRRAWLKRALATLAPSALGIGGWTAAQGAASGDYKALICITLAGGNDAFNTVLPTDEASWRAYQHQRASVSTAAIALPAPDVAPQPGASDLRARWGGVLPLTPMAQGPNAGRTLALHPSLNGVRTLYEAGRLAVLANVGPLTQPLTRSDWLNNRVAKPVKLFSHNDQLSTWHTFAPEGAPEGWGGRLMDLLCADAMVAASEGSEQAQMLRSFSCMAPMLHAPWLNARTLQPYISTNANVLSLGDGNQVMGQRALFQAMGTLMSDLPGDNLLAQAYQAVTARGLLAAELLAPRLPALGRSPWSTPGQTQPEVDPLLYFTSPVTGTTRPNQLAAQLQMVARLIDANLSGGMGLARQCFHVMLPGFDTHDNQTSAHAEAMAQLDHGLLYLDTVLSAMPTGDLRSQVTAFTTSDFGRSFTNNGDGTDHGWGGHHFILGGAVKGRSVYGRVPMLSTPDGNGDFSSPDQIHNGILLPSTSVDQYAHTLGRWMGLSTEQLVGILPHIDRFPSADQDLGFMG